MEKELKTLSDKHLKLFNSPVEIGIRALITLTEFYPEKLDFQKLLYFDYLIVNSGDVDGGPESLHPKVPFRSSSVGIRRKDLSDGLDLLISKDIMTKEYSGDAGVLYSATDISKTFLTHFKSEYYMGLTQRASWIKQVFGGLELRLIAKAIQARAGIWEPEFTHDSLTRSDWYTKEC